MSDLLQTALAVNASSNASAAASDARKAREAAENAQNASEERLESSSRNPFITFDDAKIESESVPGTGFFGSLFGSSKERISTTNFTRYSIKKTDIAYLTERKDDYGNVYTRVQLESRCDLVEMDGISYLDVVGTMAEIQAYINAQ